MNLILLIFQIIISCLLILAILAQAKGTGLGSTMGSRGDFYRSKRGAEKLLFVATIVLSFLFLFGAIVNMLISSK